METTPYEQLRPTTDEKPLRDFQFMLHATPAVLVAHDGECLVGSVGLECYEDVGILRSLAVTSETRGSGLGTRLVEELFALAREEGPRELYLLTTTAENYFPRFGFEIIPREQADPRLRASREFQDACPESAICMRRTL